MSGDLWLRPREAAERAGVSAITIRNWTETRGLVWRRMPGSPRHYLASSLDAIIARKGMPAAAQDGGER